MLSIVFKTILFSKVNFVCKFKKAKWWLFSHGKPFAFLLHLYSVVGSQLKIQIKLKAVVLLVFFHSWFVNCMPITSTYPKVQLESEEVLTHLVSSGLCLALHIFKERNSKKYFLAHSLWLMLRPIHCCYNVNTCITNQGPQPHTQLCFWFFLIRLTFLFPLTRCKIWTVL